MKKILFLIAVMTFVAIGKSEAIYYLPQKAPSTPSVIATQYQVSYPIRNLPDSDTGKNQLVAALLAYFLGNYGIHSFYLGYKERGRRQLFLSLGSMVLASIGGAGTSIFVALLSENGDEIYVYLVLLSGVVIVVAAVMALISWIWGLIDFIRILTGDLKPASGEYEGPDWF